MHIRTRIRSAIGEVPLERLNAGHIEDLLAATGGSPGTVHRIFATLRAALNAAVKQRRILHNPCDGIELEPENPAEAKRWTPAHAAPFIAYTAGGPMGLMFRIAVLRGPRRAELCGAAWSCTGLEAGVIAIEAMLLQLGGKLAEGTPKTRAGERLVFLDAETAELLRAHHTAQLRARMRAGAAWHDHGLIFCQPDGLPWNPDHVSRRFRRVAAEAGVPVIKLHEARHSAISLMRDAGVRSVDPHSRGRAFRRRDLRQVHAHPDRGAPGCRRAGRRAGPGSRGRVMTRTDVPLVFLGSTAAGCHSSAQDHVPAGQKWWGGWGSNPRPADYESAALTG